MIEETIKRKEWMMKFTAPLTGHASQMRGENVYGVTFDLGIPAPDTPSQYPKKGWLSRKLCHHKFEQLGERVGIYFFQERMGYAYHYVCNKCGETHVVETD